MPTEAIFVFLQRHSTTLMAGSLLVGLGLPTLAHWLNPIVLPFAVGTMIVSLVRIRWQALTLQMRRPLSATAAGITAMLIPPLAVWAAQGWLLPEASAVTVGVGIMSAMPPLQAAPAYAMLLGLNGAFALLGSLAGALATPFLTPWIVDNLLGIELAISPTQLTTRLAVMLAVAAGVAAVIRRSLGESRLQAQPAYLDGAMVLVICPLGVGAMDGVSAVLAAEPAIALVHIGAAFAMCIVFQGLGLALFWWLGLERALTVGLLWGFRNGFLALAAVGDAAGPEVRLFIVVFQFPLYMMPALMRRPVRWWLKPRS